jgi:DNA-binding transcriptional LysR family regulator
VADAKFDSDLLRTFVAIADCGGFAKAAARLHSTQSTVSQQMRRLEAQAERPLFAAAGRRRVLTEAGQVLLDYARKILALHEAADAALRDGEAGGIVRLGATQDFAEGSLWGVLRSFGRTHRVVRVEVRVGMSRDLRAMVDDGLLDAAVVFDDPRGRPGTRLSRRRVCWLAATDFAPPRDGAPWPLALFEAPCSFRALGLAALDAANIPWRIAYTSPSLTGILAAVKSGLAVTARFADSAPGRVSPLGDRAGLPPLGSVRTVLLTSAEPASPALAALSEALLASARAKNAASARPAR